MSTKHDSSMVEPFKENVGYFATPELAQRLSLIGHLLQNSEQLLLVLAEAGYGKTSLSNQLQKTADEHWRCFMVNGHSALSVETFISSVLDNFNVPQAGKSMQVLQEALRSHIAATRYNGQLPVLLIDDAHMLPLATLKFIVELAMQGEAQTRMRVILFCEPQITSILATPEFKIVHNTLVHHLDIPALAQEQIRDYILFYLKNTRYASIHPFSEDAVKKIYQQSEGIPGQINVFAQHVLNKFTEQRPESMLLHSSGQWWGITAFLVLCVGGWFIYQFYFNQPLSDHQKEMALSLPLQPETLESPDEIEITEEMPIETEPEVAVGDDTNLTTYFDNPTIKGEIWLGQQTPTEYTIQLLGAYDLLSLKNYLTQYALNDVAVFKTTHHDKDWFVLVYGVYPNRTTASMAIKQLPTNLRQNNPWVRTFSSIQTSMQPIELEY